MFRVKYKTSKKVTCSHCGCSVLVLDKVEFLGLGYAYCSEECAWADFSAKLTTADLMGIVRKMKSLEDNAGALQSYMLHYLTKPCLIKILCLNGVELVHAC